MKFRRPAFLNQEFLKLLSFRILMVLAYQMIAVVVAWHLYALTHDPLALGLLGLAEVIPYFSTALFAGYAVDHYSKRMLGMLAASLMLANAVLLALLAAGSLPGSPIFWIYASTVLTGFARAYVAPTYGALFAIVQPRQNFVRAAGFGSSVFQAGLVLGPAIGGLMLAFASMTFAYILAGLLIAGALFAMWAIGVKEPTPEPSAPMLQSIVTSLRFVYSNQILLAAQCLDMFAVFFGGAVSMLPVFVHQIFGHGAEGLGMLRAAPAIGAMLSGLYLAKHPINLHAGRWLLSSVAAFGICIISFALTRDFLLAFAFLLLSGVFDGVSVVLRTTILQLSTPDGLRGRVSAINGIFIGSSNELGAFESGLTAKFMGLVPSVIFGGCMTLLVATVTAHLAPKLRKLELQELH